MRVPPFLRFLELEPGAAGEPEIRRAYARRLKAVDPGSDPEGFQALREAYEAALAWARSREARAGAEPLDAELGPGWEEEPWIPFRVAPLPRPQPAEGLEQRSDGSGGSPATAPSPAAQASQLLAELMEATRCGGSPASAAPDPLASLLADPRLEGLEVHEHLEQAVAEHLAGGWQPGNELLLPGAALHFRWIEDRLGVRRLGWAGWRLDQAITERLGRGQDLGETAEERKLLDGLRQDAKLSTGTLLRSLARLEVLGSQYPSWLGLVAPVDKLESYRERARAVPRWRRAAAAATGVPDLLRRRTRLRRREARPPVQSGKRAGWWTAVWVAIVIAQVARFASDALAPAKTAPPPYRPPPGPSSPGGRVPSLALPGPATTPVPEGIRCEGKSARACLDHLEACRAGAGLECATLSDMLTYGRGVPVDPQRAAALSFRACDLRAAASCNQIGAALVQLSGEQRDLARAASFHERACSMGSVAGCSDLAHLTEIGAGVAPDLPRAAQLYAKACEGNDARGCGRLGLLYLRGVAVPRDPNQARQLLAKSCSLGHQPACEDQRELSTKE